MSMDRPVVALAAALQATVTLALMELYSLETAVLWAGSLAGITVAVTSRNDYSYLRDGFVAGMLATALVVVGYYLFLDGLAVDAARAAPERHVITENGRTVGTVYRNDTFWFQGAAVFVGFIVAPVVGFVNAVSAVLARSLYSGLAAFKRGMRDAR